MKAQAQSIIRAAAAVTVGSLAATALACTVYANAVFASVGRDLDDPEGITASAVSAEEFEVIERPATDAAVMRVSSI